MRSSWLTRRTQVASPVSQARLLGSEQKDQEEKCEGVAHGWRDGAEKGKCFRHRTTVEAYTETAPPESSALAHSTDKNPPAVRLTAVGRDGLVAEEVRRLARRAAQTRDQGLKGKQEARSPPDPKSQRQILFGCSPVWPIASIPLQFL
jgi:hypothetical protein